MTAATSEHRHAELYGRILDRDAIWDGQFFFGVVSTGVYCVPSCPARRPLPANVYFFETAAEARGSGLRPCRRCSPDDLAGGRETAVADIALLIEEVRATPGRFHNVADLAARSGYGLTRLAQLLRSHFAVTPAALLLEARLDTAQRLLAEGSEPLSEIAFEAGFGSLSAFHEQFKKRFGKTPAAYRAIGREG